MPAGAAYFTLEVNGQRIHQALADGVQATPPIPVAPSSTAQRSAAPPIPPAQSIPSAPKWQAPPAPPTPAAPAMQAPAPTPAPAAADDDDDALWKGIDLEFNKEGAKAADDEDVIELEEQKDEEST